MGGVAPAARDDAQGRFSAGEAVGYAGGELVAWGDPAATLAATLDRIAAGAELLTCIAGDGPPLGRDAVEARVPEGVEVEYHEGGQPAWWWLLCARVESARTRRSRALRLPPPAHAIIGGADPFRLHPTS